MGERVDKAKKRIGIFEVKKEGETISMPEKKKDDYYSYIVINTTKRAGFLMVFMILFVMMTLAIMANIIKNGSFSQVLFPIILIGSPIALYPAVEKWVYQPWQAKAQKYERHYRN